MDKFIKFFTDMPKEKNRFGLRCVMVVCAVICQGFGVFWLNNIEFGTDPCSVLNYGIAGKVGLSFGTTLFIYNCLLFIAVALLKIKQIGVGTLANMVLVGYSADFFEWLFGKFLPDGFFEPMQTRVIILVPALVWFVIAAATYMAVDLGQSPYDSMPMIISDKLPKIPFTVIRVIWDFAMALIGFALGSTLGVVTVLMCVALGPAITAVKKFLQKVCGFR